MSANAYQPPTGISAFPPVVKNLLILNGLAFLAQVVFQARAGSGIGAMEWWFALWPSGIPDVEGAPSFYVWQLVTSAFLHGDLTHILFNMFGLWMFGAVIEQTLGSKRFLTFYLICVLGASLLQLVVTSWPFWMGDLVRPIPTLGASGGVLGVLAAFGMLYPDQKIFLLFIPVPIPAKWFVLGYAAFSLFAGVQGVQAGVAHFAHLGGMIVGAGLILYWRRQRQLRRSM